MTHSDALFQAQWSPNVWSCFAKKVKLLQLTHFFKWNRASNICQRICSGLPLAIFLHNLWHWLLLVKLATSLSMSSRRLCTYLCAGMVWSSVLWSWSLVSQIAVWFVDVCGVYVCLPLTKPAINWILSCFFVLESNHTQIVHIPTPNAVETLTPTFRLELRALKFLKLRRSPDSTCGEIEDLKFFKIQQIQSDNQIIFSLWHSTLQLHLGPSVSLVYFCLLCLALQYNSLLHNNFLRHNWWPSPTGRLYT